MKPFHPGMNLLINQLDWAWGGLAVLHRSCFKIECVSLQDFPSFKCLAQLISALSFLIFSKPKSLPYTVIVNRSLLLLHYVMYPLPFYYQLSLFLLLDWLMSILSRTLPLRLSPLPASWTLCLPH